MATGNKFNSFVSDLASKVHNFGSDAIYAMLSNASPVATNTQRSQITEISAGNGYTAGGAQATLVSSSQVGGVYSLILNDAIFMASGGNIGPYRYAVFYNFTNSGASYPLICWFDYGSNITITNGNSQSTLLNSVTGVLQLQ